MKGRSVAAKLQRHSDANRVTETNIEANTHMQTDKHKHTPCGHPGRLREMETLTVFITLDYRVD